MKSNAYHLHQGYINLKNENKLDFLLRLKHKIQDCELQEIFSSPFILRSISQDTEIIVRQFLVSILLGNEFNKKILIFLSNKKKIISPLPKQWRKILEEEGIAVNHFFSSVLFGFLVLKFYIFSYFEIFYQIFLNFKNIFNNKNYSRNPYIYFDSLGLNNLPHSNSDSYEIMSWYKKKYAEENKLFCHSVINFRPPSDFKEEIFYKASPSIILNSYAHIFSLIVEGFRLIAFSSINFFKLRWWHALLGREMIKALPFKIANIDKNLIAKEYFFHNSGWIYRPVWSYIAEEKGAKIIFYYYSTNNQNFSLKHTKKNYISRLPWYGIKIMTWPHYLVWDAQQQNFILANVERRPSTEIVGPIWFSDNNIRYDLKKNSLLIFDVPPFKETIAETHGLDIEIHHPFAALKFIKDIYEATQQFDINIYIKCKRENPLMEPIYLDLLKKISKNSNIFLLDPNISAHSVIPQSIGTINYPFTSTAQISIEENIPAIYYDPLSIFNKNQFSIPILDSKPEIESWITALLTND
jgi:polysaccharide biosynthesis PFTS motif protein